MLAKHLRAACLTAAGTTDAAEQISLSFLTPPASRMALFTSLSILAKLPSASAAPIYGNQFHSTFDMHLSSSEIANKQNPASHPYAT